MGDSPLVALVVLASTPGAALSAESEPGAGDIDIPFEKFTLNNGLTLVVHEDHQAPVVAVNVWYHVGSKNEQPGHLLGAVNRARLDEQRGVVQNEKRQGENQPYGRGYEALFENVFPTGHPYSWSVIGGIENLNAASLDDVQEWFKGYKLLEINGGRDRSITSRLSW